MREEIKKKIILASKNFIEVGFNIGSEGNISVRNGQEVLITPSGINTLKMKESDISIIDMDGLIKNSVKPSSESEIHLSIYRKKKNAGAVVHCHSHWASVLSCLRQKIPAFHYMVAELGGVEIKCAEYATFGTKQLARNVVSSLKDTNGCLISNHGQICYGKDIFEAVQLSYAIEKLSKQYYFCLISKKVKLLDNDEIRKVLKKFKSYKVKH